MERERENWLRGFPKEMTQSREQIGWVREWMGVCVFYEERRGCWIRGCVVWGWEGEMLIGWVVREEWSSHLQPPSPPWRRFVLFLFTIHNSGQLSCQNMWPTFVKSANKWGANICYVKVVEASGRSCGHNCWRKKWTISDLLLLDYSVNLKILVSNQL